MGMPKLVPPRAAVGGLIGLVLFSLDAIAMLVRFVLNPAVAERATMSAFLAMFLFLFLFMAAGALAGYLWTMRIRFLRFVSIGTLTGAMVWSYLTATWPLTAQATAVVPPQTPVTSAMLIGAGGGALGGMLLFAISGIGRWLRDHG